MHWILSIYVKSTRYKNMSINFAVGTGAPDSFPKDELYTG